MFCELCQEQVDGSIVNHVRLFHDSDDIPELMPDGKHYVVIDETDEK